jgi:predicted transposase YdaD
MPKTLKAFKDAVGQAQEAWRNQQNGKVFYEDVVLALDTAEKRRYEASQHKGSYSQDDQKEFYRLSNYLRDMKGVIIRPNLKRNTQPYPGPVNIV